MLPSANIIMIWVKKCIKYMSENKLVAICWGFVFVYPLNLIWQGFDISDQGFWLSSYRMFRLAPESISLLLWLSLAIGSLVDLMSAGVGAVAFRLAFVFVTWGCAILTWRFFKQKDREPVAFGVVGAVVLFSFQNTCWIGYDSLSGLFLLASAILCLKATCKNVGPCLFFSGFLAGCSFFVRTPVILVMIPLLFVAFVDDIKSRIENDRFVPMRAIFLLFGCIASLLAICFVIWALGHWNQFAQGLRDLFCFPASRNTVESHSVSPIMRVMRRDIIAVLRYMAIFGVTLLSVKAIKYSVLKIVFWGAGVFWFFSYCPEKFMIHALSGICFVIVLENLLAVNRSWASWRLGIMSVAISMCAFAGSSSGFFKAKNCLWLLLPLSVILIACRLQSEKGRKIARVSTWLPAGAMISVLIFCFAWRGIARPQRDYPNRLKLTARVNHPDARFIFTTPERAESINEVLAYFDEQDLTGKSLLCCGRTAMFHYLLRMPPAMGLTWPFAWQLAVFEEKLAQIGAPPAYILVPRYATSHSKWPQEKVSISKGKDYPAKMLMVDEYLLEKKYSKDWESDNFIIYVAPK